MLSEKIYPNGINPTVSDDISPDVAYSCRENGEELKKLDGKLADLGSALSAQYEERSYTGVIDVMNRIDVLIEDIRELQNNVYDTMNEEMRQTGRIGA